MQAFRKTAFALSVTLLSLAFADIGAAATTLKVSLWDKGDHKSALGTPIMLGTMDEAALAEALKTAKMGITLDMAEVPAGEVIFDVTNDSDMIEHEMLVAPIADLTTPMPYDAVKMRVDESLSNDLGEVPELLPAESGSLTLTLTPGIYLLYCNIQGHYAMGMWTILTVKG